MSSIEAMGREGNGPIQLVNRRDNGTFAPGSVPNPWGRYGKDKPSVTEALIGLLAKQPAETVAMAQSLIENFKAGNASAIKEVLGRLDGSITERSETLIRKAEESEMSREAILIAAEAIRRQDAEKEAATLPVQGGLPSEGTSDTQTGG